MNSACHLSAVGFSRDVHIHQANTRRVHSEAAAVPSRSWESFKRIAFALCFHPRAR